MSRLQDLNNEQIDQSFVCASEKQIPATLMVKGSRQWNYYHCRILAASPTRIYLSSPTDQDGNEVELFEPARKFDLTFKLKHYKHLCGVTVVGSDTVKLSDGVSHKVLSVCSPTRMQRLQRRAYRRVQVPQGKVVRVSFWLGGINDEPSGVNPDRPVWSAQVCDLSAGGFQARLDHEDMCEIESGETVGLRLAFGVDGQSIYAEAQFRHKTNTQDGAVFVGFQFLGLEHDRKGREVLRIISAKVAEFQFAQEQKCA